MYSSSQQPSDQHQHSEDDNGNTCEHACDLTLTDRWLADNFSRLAIHGEEIVLSMIGVGNEPERQVEVRFLLLYIVHLLVIDPYARVAGDGRLDLIYSLSGDLVLDQRL